MVQNSLARAVLPSFKRSDHITPALIKLHWLPIKQRINFKIASITYKTLHYKQPSYLFDLLHHNKPSRTLRSAALNQLVVPFIKTEIGRRSFSYSAPTIWNLLPSSVRDAPSLPTFNSLLKTFLFKSHFFPP
jgi:hypothetical protein